MWSKIVFVMMLLCLVDLAWSKPEAIAFACPTGYKYLYGRCFESDLLNKVQLEELDK